VLTLEEQAAKRAEEQIAYARARFPRLPDAPETAPVFDKLAQPVTFPVIAGCVSYVYKGFEVCKCVTQQATPVVVTEAFCRNFVAHGAFDPYQGGTSREGARVAGDERRQHSAGDRAQEEAARASAPFSAAVAATALGPAKQR
jgi:zona occludens toxin